MYINFMEIEVSIFAIKYFIWQIGLKGKIAIVRNPKENGIEQ